MSAAYDGVVVDVFELHPGNANSDEIARSAEALRGFDSDETLTVSAPGLGSIPVPGAMSHVLGAILHEARQGHVVAVVSTAQEISTGAAARLLGVSRPHVTRLIDLGILPGRRLKRHRRVRLADVMEFKRNHERRRRLLDEVANESQELGLYEPPRD
jgi:excisionase family DNA binding protein